jgi:hypothetical protein
LDLEVQGTIDIIEDSTGLLQYTITGTPQSVTPSGAAGLGPLAMALQVRFHTNGVVKGHRVVGSTYIAPLDSSTIENDGTPTTAAVGYAQAFGSSLSTTGSYGKLVTYHRPTTKGGTDGVAYDVVSATVKDSFAVLRSRRA